jgi:hypothetical protein
MEYFVLEHRHPNSGYVNGSVKYLPPLVSEYIREAQDLDKSLEAHVVLDSEVRNLKLDFFAASEAFFASVAFANLISDSDQSVEIRPAFVSYHNGVKTEKQYVLLHAPKKVNCFNYELSEYPGKELILKSRSEGTIRRVNTIKKLVLDTALIGKRAYFMINHEIAILDPLIDAGIVNAARAQKLKIAPVPLTLWHSGMRRQEIPRTY